MNELFGVSMNLIMYILLGALGVSLAVVLYVIVQNRVMFLIGVRNMPRRVAQTALIIIGLMLSTLIISAAFTTGDTVNHSLSATSYNFLGHMDEWVQLRGEEDSAPLDIDSSIPPEITSRLRAAITTADDPNIDGFLPVLLEEVPIFNPRTRLSEPSVNFVGPEAHSLEDFPDAVSTTTGKVVDIASLAADEAFMNKSAAGELAAEPGDRVQVFVQGQPHEFTVVDIVEDTVLTGVGDFDATGGLVTRLATLQKLFDRPGEVNFIAISNRGGVRDGLNLSDEVVVSLETIIESEGLARGEFALRVYDVKRDLVETSELAGNIMATFFVIFGLFSIAAGTLLIIMIFVMLAAERKSELGMARAVGTKRGHLVEMFLSEGMAYNLLAAMVGALLGIAVAIGITNIMGRIFNEFSLNIQPHVTLRSLVISYSLGVVLTFVTVTFASWRVSNLNIVAAIRDLEENKLADAERGTLKGFLRALLNVLVVIALLPISVFYYYLRDHPFSFPADQRVMSERIPLWPLLLLLLIPVYLYTGWLIPPWPLLLLLFVPFYLYSGLMVLLLLPVALPPAYLLAVGLVAVTRDRRPQSISAWLLLAGIVAPPLGLVVAALQRRGQPIAWGVGAAALGVVLGALLIFLGLNGNEAFPFALGCSLVLFGLAIILSFFGLSDRLVYTSASAFLLVFWGFMAGDRLEWLVGPLEGDVEMFFLSGVVMVAASTFVLVYNSDIVLGVISRGGDVFGSMLPAVKTAIAYPLASKFRTGMTLAMISLVMFALTMMATMNYNFSRLFLDDSSRGGWDVIVAENPNNPIADLSSELRAVDSAAPESFRAAGRVSVAGDSTAREVRIGGPDYGRYPVIGVDTTFAENGQIPLSARAVGYDNDEAVWTALATNPDVAVIDHFTVDEGGPFGGGGFTITGIDAEAEAFDPISLSLRDPIGVTSSTVQVIGVIDLGASASFFGIYVSEATFQEVFGEPLFSLHFVSLEDPGESRAVAQEIEASLLTLGAQADSLKQQVEDGQRFFNNFFLLMQGFMGLGLFVGIAAVGVIAFRTVVERRQQIGMLRAIGYQRSTIALSFMLESSFVTLLGIASGIGLAIWLSYFLLSSDEFPTSNAGYAIPWLRILAVASLTFAASLVMTFVPSRQAASVPIAEALRYE